LEAWDAAGAKAVAAALVNRRERVCGVDCETEGINPKKEPAAGPKGRIVCWTVSWDDQDAFIWATPDTWAVLAPVLHDLPIVGHNWYGFDGHMFRKAGAPCHNIVADTLRMHRLINTDEEASHGLKSLMKWWLGIEPVGGFEELFTRLKKLEDAPETDLKETKRKVGDTPKVPTLLGGAHSRVGSLREVIPLSEIPTTYPGLLPTLVKYAKLDARATLELWKLFDAKLKEMPWEYPLLQHYLSPKTAATAD
jgi:hypothetical protein